MQKVKLQQTTQNKHTLTYTHTQTCRRSSSRSFFGETQQQNMIKNDFFEKCIRTTTTRTSARERDMPEMSRKTA